MSEQIWDNHGLFELKYVKKKKKKSVSDILGIPICQYWMTPAGCTL